MMMMTTFNVIVLTFGLHKMRGISGLAEDLLASQLVSIVKSSGRKINITRFVLGHQILNKSVT
jgi:hypothetical protein